MKFITHNPETLLPAEETRGTVARCTNGDIGVGTAGKLKAEIISQTACKHLKRPKIYCAFGHRMFDDILLVFAR